MKEKMYLPAFLAYYAINLMFAVGATLAVFIFGVSFILFASLFRNRFHLGKNLEHTNSMRFFSFPNHFHPKITKQFVISVY